MRSSAPATSSVISTLHPLNTSKSTGAPPRAAKTGKRRLSFHEKHALETLPEEIAALQASLRRLQDQLGDPNLYARDRQAFAQSSAALSATQSQLATAEERWLELEMLREEIEGG